jgi:DNA-binding response OmpR family regulator
VKNIRRKLEPVPARPRYLLTVYGVGYRVADPES